MHFPLSFPLLELFRTHLQLFSHHVGYPGPSNLLEFLRKNATELNIAQTKSMELNQFSRILFPSGPQSGRGFP